MSDEENSLEYEGPKGLGLKSPDPDDSDDESDDVDDESDKENKSGNPGIDKLRQVKRNKKRKLIDASARETEELIQIKSILSNEEITPKHFRKIEKLTNDAGDHLNPVYVKQCMEGRGNSTIFMQRNPGLFPNSKKISGYVIFSSTYTGNENEKGKVLIFNVHAILSTDGKKTMTNLMGNDKKFKIKSCGQVMLDSLVKLMAELFKSNLGYSKGEIQLDAVWNERTVSFYRKNKFEDDYRRKSNEIGMIPMFRTIEIYSPPEDNNDNGETPKISKNYRRKLIYQGTNQKGNIYFSYDDGSYSYINRDRITGEPWIYDSRTSSLDIQNAENFGEDTTAMDIS